MQLLSILVFNLGKSKNAAAKFFNIPRTTIRRKIQNPETKSTYGPEPVLTTVVEQKIVNWIANRQKAGYPITKRQLLNTVQNFMCGRDNPFKNNKPGKFYLFTRCHKLEIIFFFFRTNMVCSFLKKKSRYCETNTRKS
jgi:hypothetical protein